MSFCPESKMRSEMTDAEFWDHVFGRSSEEEESWSEYHWAMNEPDIWAIDCVRCGRTVEVEDPAGRERDAFCDDCATEHIPEVEETS